MPTFDATGLEATHSEGGDRYMLKPKGDAAEMSLSQAEAAWLWPLLKQFAKRDLGASQAAGEAMLAGIDRDALMRWDGPKMSDEEARRTYLDDTGRTRDIDTHQLWEPGT